MHVYPNFHRSTVYNSQDIGLILLTLSLYLSAALAGVYAGQKLAWLIYCKRNPDLTKEEE